MSKIIGAIYNAARWLYGKRRSFLNFLFWFMLFKVVVYTPIMMGAPAWLNVHVIYPSKLIYETLISGGGIALEAGKTCNQETTTCIDSFNLQGAIDKGDGKAFISKLSKLKLEKPDINTVCLDSGGGRNDAAAEIAAEIRRLELNTCVGDISFKNDDPGPETGIRYTNTCASACTFILLSGKERIAIGERFKLGMHSPRNELDTKDGIAEQASTNAKTISFTQPELLEKEYLRYKDLVSINDEQLRAVLTAASRTPAFKMYSASVGEQMELGFFSQRLP